MATGGWIFQTGWAIHVGDLSSRRIIQQFIFFRHLQISPCLPFSHKIHFPTWWWWRTGILKKETLFMIWRIIFTQEAGFFPFQQSQLICFNLKPPSWQYLFVLLKEIFLSILFLHWNSKNRRFARLQSAALFWRWFLRMPRDFSFFEKEKSQKFEIDGYGRTVWISLHLLRTKDCNTIITDFSTLISILMKDEQDPKKNLIFPRPST